MKVFRRARIGLKPPRGNYGRNGRIKGASIHHGGPVGGRRMTFAKGAQTCRDWQAYHQNVRGWTDIGYHALVDGLGRVYEGRPIHATPAAVENHNTGTVGINFMQDGRYYRLNFLQRRTLKELFEKGCPALDIPPLKTLGFVLGHKEFSGHHSNECPGELILRHLKWRRDRY